MIHSETLAETMLLTRDGARRRLRLRFVALVMAVALAMGLIGTAGPARADDDDLVKALAALAIVGIIAHASQQDHLQPAPVPRPVAGPKVPGVCAIEIVGQHSRATVYGERCIRAQGFGWRLPQGCARPARIYGQNDRIYTPQCLQNAGFRIGSNRN